MRSPQSVCLFAISFVPWHSRWQFSVPADKFDSNLIYFVLEFRRFGFSFEHLALLMCGTQHHKIHAWGMYWKRGVQRSMALACEVYCCINGSMMMLVEIKNTTVPFALLSSYNSSHL